jgi:hypothetical protein
MRQSPQTIFCEQSGTSILCTMWDEADFSLDTIKAVASIEAANSTNSNSRVWV